MAKVAEKPYTTVAKAVGGRDGHVKSADGMIDMDLRTPKVMGGPGGATNPEELFAAGYAACFNGALNMVLRMNRVRLAEDTSVTATIIMGKDEKGNFQLEAILEARIPGMELEAAEKFVAKAHTVCPYSRATHGNMEVTLITTVK